MKEHHCIITGGGLVSVRTYLAAVRALKAMDPGTLTTANFEGWWTVTAGEALRQVRDAVHQSINRQGGEEWRNVGSIREDDERRDARDLHNWLQNRVICRRLRSPRLQRRFGHLLYQDDE